MNQQKTKKSVLDGDGKNWTWYRKRCPRSNYASRNGTNRMQNVKRMSKILYRKGKSPVKAGKETVNKRKCSNILCTQNVRPSNHQLPLNNIHRS